MAAIQYVGFPKITPRIIVKYGYIPQPDGSLAWFVTEVRRSDMRTEHLYGFTRSIARGMANQLIKRDLKWAEY